MSQQVQNEVFNYAKTNLIKVSVYIKDPYISKFVTEEKITGNKNKPELSCICILTVLSY